MLPESIKLKFLPSDEFSKAQVRNNPSIPASMLLLHVVLKVNPVVGINASPP